MKVALYARTGGAKQYEQDVNLNNQVQEIESWVNENGHIIVEKYLDRGSSALDYTRPAFQKLLKDVHSPDHRFDAIVVHSLSRLFRNVDAMFSFEKELDRLKVKLISINQPNNGDMDGRMVLRIIAAFDEYFSFENAENVRRSMINNAMQGFFNGSIAPFGYMAVCTAVKSRNGFKRRLEINTDEAEIVRIIFYLAFSGIATNTISLINITEKINNLGQSCRGREWTKRQVIKILKSQIYCGIYSYNKFNRKNKKQRAKTEWITVSVPPIVSKEDYETVANYLSEHNQARLKP